MAGGNKSHSPKVKKRVFQERANAAIKRNAERAKRAGGRPQSGYSGGSSGYSGGGSSGAPANRYEGRS